MRAQERGCGVGFPVDPSGGRNTCSHPSCCPLSALPVLSVGALYNFIPQEMQHSRSCGLENYGARMVTSEF